MAVITSPVIKDTTGQQIVNALDDIATLMENNVIDDTSIASNKTWSSYKINADIASKIPSTATSSNKLVDNSAMQSAISSAVSSAYHAAGTKTVAELTSSLLVAANEGNVYNITDSGVTTADFVEGAGKPINIGDNVGICESTSGTYKFDLLSGFIDTSDFIEKSSTVGLVKNDGTIDTTSYATTSALTNKTDLTVIAPAWSSSASYSDDDLVTNAGVLQRYDGGAEPWTTTTVAEELKYKQPDTRFNSADFTIVGSTGAGHARYDVSLNKDTIPTENSSHVVESGGVFSVIGALSSLTTTVKTNIVNAINELVTAITGINNKIPITASSVNQLVTESDVDLGLSISDGKLCVKYEK